MPKRKRPERPKHPNSFLIVSYWPLIDITTPRMYDTDIVDRVNEFTKDLPDIKVDACLWVNDEESGGVAPVFLMQNAKDVLDHLLRWCENDPTKWFTIMPRDLSNDRYLLMLHPNLQMSINRFRLLCLHQYGFIPPEDADYKLIYRPLEFASRPSEMYQRLKSSVGDTIRLGFLDTDRFDMANPNLTPFEEVSFIGPVPVDRAFQVDLSPFEE